MINKIAAEKSTGTVSRKEGGKNAREFTPADFLSASDIAVVLHHIFF